jgi:DNA-binding Lrp family transcriptional regulator
MTTSVPGAIDRLDAALIELLAAEPRVGVLEASRRLGAARGTVQARLDRMRDRGVITGYGPDVDPAAIGYEVTAFITLEIRQAGGHDPVAERLAAIPEVLEVHTITGAGDMLCRVVARTNADLQRVLDAIVSAEGVVRSSTLISLATQVPYRILPLVRAAGRQARDAWLRAGSRPAEERCLTDVLRGLEAGEAHLVPLRKRCLPYSGELLLVGVVKDEQTARLDLGRTPEQAFWPIQAIHDHDVEAAVGELVYRAYVILGAARDRTNVRRRATSGDLFHPVRVVLDRDHLRTVLAQPDR